MCSYNAINGVPACLDFNLLNGILRRDMKWDGFIASDSGAIKEAYKGHKYTDSTKEAVREAVEASCDVNSGHGSYYSNMGGAYATGSPFTDNIPSLVESGALSETLVNE